MNNEAPGSSSGESRPSVKALPTWPYAVERKGSLDEDNATNLPRQKETVLMLKRLQLEKLLNISCSQIYALMAKGQFPQSINYCDGSGVYWIAEEIMEWLETQIQNSREAGRKKG